MKYTKVTYKEETGRCRFYYERKKNGWEGGGNLFDIYYVDDYYVAVGINQKPFKVFTNWDEIRAYVKYLTGIVPVFINQ